MKDLIYTFKNHPNVGNIRGKGLFVGIELVKDRLKKHPFDPALDLATKIKTIAFENGLICYPGQGTVDGIVGDHILLAPPYIFKESHIEELIDKLSLSLDKAISFHPHSRHQGLLNLFQLKQLKHHLEFSFLKDSYVESKKPFKV